jgi:hypothetical protein
MYPLNDNDLDRLSRDAAEQYDVDQNVSTSGWEALESRLNKELPLKDEKERRRFLFWLFFIVLVAGGSLWWMLSGDNTDAAGIAHAASAPAIVNDGKNNTPPASSVSPNPGIAQEETKTIIDKQTAPPSAETPAAGQTPSAPQQSTVTDQPKTDPVIANKIVAPGKETTTANGKALFREKNRKESYTGLDPVINTGKKKKGTAALLLSGNNDDSNKAGTNRTGTKNPPGKKKSNGQQGISGNNNTTTPGKDKLATAGEQEDKKEVVTDLPKAAAANPLIITPVTDKAADTTAIAKAPLVAPQPLAKDSAAIAKKPADKKNNKKVKGFEIGIVGGPDKSNVKFTHSSNAGYNIGLQVGYRFSNRWSVNTGLLYTKKNYKADGKDATKYGWLAGPNVDVYALEGYCSMLDIPLNVRYDFSVTPKNRFFASTGLSTYIMKNEDYDYYYKYGAVNTTYNWNTGKGGGGDSTYLFSILNLSAGFERSLNKHFSIQAEPYLKLPLSQLGYAKLNLSSYGIYFSLKYRIAK